MNTLLKNLSALVLILFLSCVANHALAADKALIIGVEQYQNPRLNLKGIQLDVDAFKQTAMRLGVDKNNIRILMNENATEANIKRMFNTFLKDVGSKDNVYIYFSGHGSQMADVSGDEADNLDEFLVTYEFDHRGNKPGALTDDELFELLIAVPSERVFAFVDACHTGSISRNVALGNHSLGETDAIQKFVRYPGMPKAKPGSAIDGMDDSARTSTNSRALAQNKSSKGKVNFVTLSATQDDEVALATSKGSFFTLGLSAAVNYAMSKNEALTPEFLYLGSKAFVHASTNEDNRYTPSLWGNPDLFKTKLETQATAQQGAVWASIEELVPAQETLVIDTPKLSYKVDEAIPMSIKIPGSGYLSIVTVDQFDNATLLFPNTYNSENKVQAGQRFVINYDSVGFDLLAAPPAGNAIVVAMITAKPLDLRNRSALGRDENGKIVDLLVPVNEGTARAIKVGRAKPASTLNTQSSTQSSTSDYFAGKVVFNVVE